MRHRCFICKILKKGLWIVKLVARHDNAFRRLFALTNGRTRHVLRLMTLSSPIYPVVLSQVLCMYMHHAEWQPVGVSISLATTFMKKIFCKHFHIHCTWTLQSYNDNEVLLPFKTKHLDGDIFSSICVQRDKKEGEVIKTKNITNSSHASSRLGISWSRLRTHEVIYPNLSCEET